MMNQGLYKLKLARKAAKLTQAEMGRLLGITMAGYRQKETGERNLTIKEANRIAQILGTTLDPLFLEVEVEEEIEVEMEEEVEVEEEGLQSSE